MKARISPALATLRVQVSVALLVAAAVCAYFAGKSSGDELSGSYRDAGHAVLATSGRAFQGGFEPALLDRPAVLKRRLEAVRRLDPNLRRAVVHRVGDRRATRSPEVLQALRRNRPVQVERKEGGSHLAHRVVPLGDPARPSAALELTYDLAPFDAMVRRRNLRIFAVLSVLLLLFTAFTAFVLGRGIFRPLHKLRLATRAIAGGQSRTRLHWKRRDELGALAHDFDAMACTLEENNRRLEALALRDPLTGLANHRHFQEALADEIERARRSGGTLTLAVVDIDFFKRVNDARGHPFGDEVLQRVGQSLEDTMRDLALPARLGGDEFALILPDCDSERAEALCEAARAAVRAASPPDMELTCSAGIACFPRDATNPASLMQLADGALYWAKNTGRDRSKRYEPEHVLVVTEEQRAEFAELLERPQAVRAVFQPVVSLATGEPVGYEALARFDDNRKLPPTWWFEQAHRFGLGSKLEAEAIRHALEAPGRPAGTFLAVNVSPSALSSEDVARVLPQDLSGLVLEITEQEQVLDDRQLHSSLAPFRARGARVAVDDAGAGYAGLQQVMRMRADIIKLDRALVGDVHLDRAKAALVSSLVHFASTTGAIVCAEGVESLDELRVVARLGVSYGQGYVFARPAAPWPEVSSEAAALCRSASERAAPPHLISVPQPRQRTRARG